jgi:hypothetical protein
MIITQFSLILALAPSLLSPWQVTTMLCSIMSLQIVLSWIATVLAFGLLAPVNWTVEHLTAFVHTIDVASKVTTSAEG